MGCGSSKAATAAAEQPPCDNKAASPQGPDNGNQQEKGESTSVTIFVLGGPGSGKGTQCEKIKAQYEGVVHLSAGDLLRAEKVSGSEVGNKCAEIMKEGKLVPTEITIGLLKKAMAEKQGKCYLIDGFPRAQDQATQFEADIGLPGAVLFFDCPEDEMEKRLLKRGETSGRDDDNTEAIKKRFKTFVEESKPVQGHYERKGLAHVISAVPSPDQVFEEVVKVLDPLLKPQAAAQSNAPPAPAPAAAAPASKEESAEPAPADSTPAQEAPAIAPLDAAIVFVLGGPGSGKGTQCEKIKQRYDGVVHLSAGDLLRAEAASGSEIGEQCAAIMKEGALVPVHVTIGLLKAAMEKNREGMKMVLIDGFPRALDQAAQFEADVAMPTAVLFFECPEDEMEKRLLKRGETSGRSDDNAEAIRKRFKTFVEESLPVKGHYADAGCAHVISAVPPPDEVFEEVIKVLDQLPAK